MQLKHYKANTNIILKGEVGDKYFILKTGKCEVIVNNDSPGSSSAG